MPPHTNNALRATINQVIENVQSCFYGERDLAPTGPMLFGKILQNICYYRQNAQGDVLEYTLTTTLISATTKYNWSSFQGGDHLVIFDNFLNDMHLVWEDNRRLRPSCLCADVGV